MSDEKQHIEREAHEHHAQHASQEHASAKQRELLAYVVAALVGGLAIGFGVHALLVPATQPQQLPAQYFATPLPLQSGIGAQAAGNKAVAYLNENWLAAQGVSATLKNATEKNGLYLVSFELKQGTQAQQAQAYVSLDGKLLIIPYGNALNLDEKLDLAPAQQEIPKNNRPDVKLFVMSFCPYGKQAEQAMSPVARLLEGVVEIQPHFVVYGDYCAGGRCKEADYCIANGTYCSMHGLNELREDVRQLCVWKYDKKKWWDYVDYVNANCSLESIETCWLNASQQAGVNATLVSECLDNEAEALLAPEAALNERHGVQGSPTLLINGVQFNGGRTPESFKNAVCSAFNTPPAECSQELSSAAASTPTGGCGT